MPAASDALTSHTTHDPKDDHKHLPKQQLGFIGLGNMGRKMATNLAKFLHEQGQPALKIWTRSSAHLIEESDSIKHAKSAKEIGETCDIILTSLANDTALKAVFEELLAGIEIRRSNEKNDCPKITFVETSTIAPETCGELERKVNKIPHTFYLQAPVFGPPPLAESAALVFVLSGDHYAKSHVVDFLVPSMGRKVIDVGSNVERASAFKLNGNALILGLIEVLAEGMVLADKSGVGSDLLYEFVKMFMPAPSAIGYGGKILNNQFQGETGFTVSGGMKDAQHIRDLATACDATIPIIDLAHRNLVASKANGGGELDWSSLVAGPRLAAGLQPFTGKKAYAKDNGFGSKTEAGGEGEEPERVGGIKEVRNF